ncbi:glycosyltransferase [Halogeometricum borinquense]|uniref:Glycosyltransferase n=1 Tax=Halogeometricum borinquense TaxID=60847 RepID=A0A482TAF5_9EURY|nr:glycosyltransferase family 4 protein [Halogeometricum borinquense]RYJ13702.1 glycosyltransferase [Halogeometricum borinquense]
MNPDSARIAMLYQDPHPAHAGFADNIGADLVDFRGYAPEWIGDGVPADLVNGTRSPEYDVYLVEGSRPLYAALVNRVLKGSRLVYLCADHGLYSLGRSDFEGSSGFKSVIGQFGTPAIRAVGHRYIDGVVAVSEFAAEFTRPVVSDQTPIEVAHPFVQPEIHDELTGVSPAVDANVAVTVGRPSRYKGVDLLVEAWPKVRERHPEAELHVVGGGHPESYSDTEGVFVRGYIEDLSDVFEPASVYVQPSRMDTFPVSVLEAMSAGLPPIVTDTTGTRSEARKIDPSLVVSPNPSSLAQGVSTYFDRVVEERRRLSERARERGSLFDADSRKAAFAEAFRHVLKEL